MLNLKEIHRPKTIDEALALLNSPDTVPLAGGTGLVAGRSRDVRAVVDLSNLGLAYLRDRNGAVAIGAMSTLADVAESPMLRAAADGIIAQAANWSAASLLRNQATVVGTLIAEPAGILAAALAAMEATLTILSSPPNEQSGMSMIDFLSGLGRFLPNSIVTEIQVPRSSLTRRATLEFVARTPRDKPIVTVCPTLGFDDGVVTSAAIALGGVGAFAVRASDAERTILHATLTDSLIESAASAAMNGITPASDLRGSAEYRREMVKVLTARALREIWAR